MASELLNSPRSIPTITPDGRRTTITPEEVIDWIDQMREFASDFGVGAARPAAGARDGPITLPGDAAGTIT